MKKWLKKGSTLCVKGNVVCIMNGRDSYIYVDGSPLIDGEYDAELYKKLGKWERIGDVENIPEFKEEKRISAFDSADVKKAITFTNIKKISSSKAYASFMLAFTKESVRSTNYHIAYLSDCRDIKTMPTMIVDARSFPSRFESVELYETYAKVNVKEQNVAYYIPYIELNYVDFTKIVDLAEPSYKQLDISKNFDFLAKEAKIKDKRKEENPYHFPLDSEHSYDVRYLDILQKAGFEELHISREKTNDAAFSYNEIAIIARRRND